MNLKAQEIARAVEVLYGAVQSDERGALDSILRTRFGNAKTLGQVSFIGADVDLNLSDQYALNVASLSDLGFGETDAFPPLENIHDRMNASTESWLKWRKVYGALDELFIAPSIQYIGLQGSRRRKGIIPRFDKKQGAESKTYCELDFSLWSPDKDKHPMHDNFRTAKWQVGFLLGDMVNPSDPNVPANRANEPGLVYVGENDRWAINLFKDEAAKEFSVAKRILELVTVPEVLTVNAQRRVTGMPFLDTRTETALVQYPIVFEPSGERPSIDANKDRSIRLGFHSSYDGFSRIGVRRSLILPEIIPEI